MFSFAFSSFARTLCASAQLGRQFTRKTSRRAAAGLGACMCLATSLAGQTAHFSWTIETVGSGFNRPSGVAVDASGNIYVADESNNAVKEILAASGFTTTVTLGGGFASPFGVAVDASGNVWVADQGNSLIKEIPPSCIAGVNNSSCVVTPAWEFPGPFQNPFGVAVDGNGNVWVGDTVNNLVREIPAVITFATYYNRGSGFSVPYGVAVDGSGDVFVADTGHHQIQEIPAGCISGADNSTCQVVLAPSFAFNFPTGVAVDASGNVLVADMQSGTSLFEISATTGNPVTAVGSGFHGPSGVALDAGGRMFIADRGNNAVKKILLPGDSIGSINVGSTNAVPISLYFTFDTAGTLGSIKVLTQGAAGLDFTDAATGTCTPNTAYNAGDVCSVVVKFKPLHAGPRNGVVQLLDTSGSVLATGHLTGMGVGPQATFANTTSGAYLPKTQTSLGSGFNIPYGVALDGNGNIFVTDSFNNAVKEIVAPGYTTVSTLAGTYSQPSSIAVDAAGNVFVADYGHSFVKEIVANGGYTTVKRLGGGFVNPYGVAVDGSGNVFVADTGNDAVKEIPASCIAGANTAACVLTLGNGLSVAVPYGVAVDANENVYVADIASESVVELMAAGGYINARSLGSGFSVAQGVAVDGSGNVYVADTGNHLIEEIPTSCIAGANNSSCQRVLGQGGIPASPTGVALDVNGNVYYSSYNNTVVKLDFTHTPNLSFATTGDGQTSTDSPQTVTMTNNGNANLAFSGLAYPTDFPEASGVDTDCAASSVVAAGSDCTLSIEFSPQASSLAGTSTLLSESVDVTTNSLNATTLNGVGVSGTVTLAPATLTSPAPATVLAGPSVKFSWTIESGATAYSLRLGTTAGAFDLYGSGKIAATFVTPTGLPTNGETVYATLTTYYGSIQKTASYTFTSATKAALLSPAPSTVFAGPRVTFTWTAATGAATGYVLRLGTTPGANNVFASGTITTTSVAANVPTNGETVYVTLITDYGSIQKPVGYTFTAAMPAALSSPTPGSVLTGAKVKFTWTAATGAGVTGYSLKLGTTAGTNNLFGSGKITGTSATASALPTNGEIVYATLITFYGSVERSASYTFTAAP